ncbi:MAG: mobility-associated LCxxNW protein [Clostridium sp.]|jgi:chemotaxis regulatin CheY-phosphate phosphatase CheZ
MNNYCAFSKDHHCIKWQDYVSARLELEECDELCHGNWIEIESLQRQVHFLKKLLEENGIVLPDDYYDL